MKSIITTFFLAFYILSFGQTENNKSIVTGFILEKGTNLPLEYATISFQDVTKKSFLTGTITNEKGAFSIEIPAGTYLITAEFISFKSISSEKKINSNTTLSTFYLELDTQQLNEVEIVAERSSVEIKLDKKVYNVGSDMIVKGGTINDVLDNVPSVAVDADGSVTLRGNENVRILIDGKPSGLAGINISDALKSLPADSVEKVEVITNPSARYDAEGGGGIINIILKKGKNKGINGSVLVTTGIPDNHTFSANMNYKTEVYNLFTTQGYGVRNTPGDFVMNSEYLNNNGETLNFTNEKRIINRNNNGYNGTLGIELYTTKSTSWTHVLNYRSNDNKSPEEATYMDFDAFRNLTSQRSRYNDQNANSNNIQYASNFVKKFTKEDHKLTADFSYSKNKDDKNSIITERSLTSSTPDIVDRTSNNQNQNQLFFQTDYVLPINNDSRFEFGYRANYNELLTDYGVGTIQNGTYTPNLNFTNSLDYKEKINALYSQFGSKIKKFSYLVGLRWEDSNIDINQLTSQQFNKKRYNNFFPSGFITYEFSETSNLSVNYSRRISRPRDRQINPFSEYTSNINYFQGNPDLNPAISNVYEVGYLKRWKKLTFNTSLYYNNINNSFQYIKRESGEFITTVVVGGTDFMTPVIVTTPVNIGFTDKIGFEFTLNYTPIKWWKLNSNFNFFRNQTHGSFSYVNSITNETVTQRFDNLAFSWFTRINSKIALPKGIDFQTNATYNAPMTTAQGNLRAVISGNLALSKDVLKEKATIALNVSDIFNSRKRKQDVHIPNLVNSRQELQFRTRQITLSFTYRFNKKKNERDKQPNGSSASGGGEEF